MIGSGNERQSSFEPQTSLPDPASITKNKPRENEEEDKIARINGEAALAVQLAVYILLGSFFLYVLVSLVVPELVVGTFNLLLGSVFGHGSAH